MVNEPSVEYQIGRGYNEITPTDVQILAGGIRIIDDRADDKISLEIDKIFYTYYNYLR